MTVKKILFWQPRRNVLSILNSHLFGRILVIIMNYLIWLLLFYISFLLIKFQTKIFWQILFATLLGELIEKYGKSHALWQRPLFQRNDSTPVGLVDRWYKTGSFPSGHTLKAVFFLLFLIQYPVFPITNYVLLVTPLLFFRILIGFHYPIDILGGVFFGSLTWLLTHQILFPEFLTKIIRVIFNFVFRL